MLYGLVAMIRVKHKENEIFSRSGKGREFCVRNDRKSLNLKFKGHAHLRKNIYTYIYFIPTSAFNAYLKQI